MVRQDKITFLVSYFHWHVPVPRPQIVDPLDGLIQIVLDPVDPLIAGSEKRDLLLQSVGAWSNLTTMSVESLTALCQVEHLPHKRVQTVHRILNWWETGGGIKGFAAINHLSNHHLIARLCHIPGIGRTTATLFLALILKRDLLPITRPIHRVLTRVGIVSRHATEKHLADQLNPVIPCERYFALYWQLLHHSQQYCTVRTPLCTECPFAEHCDKYRHKNDWCPI